MMQTIIVKLEPGKLANPDLDLRYLIPDRIEEISDGAIQDNGYDYLEDDSLGIWLRAESAEGSYPVVIKMMQEERFLGNDLAQAAEVYISELESDEFENCRKVFPL